MPGSVSLCVVSSGRGHGFPLPDALSPCYLFRARILLAFPSALFRIQLAAGNCWQLAFQRHQAATEQITLCELNFLRPEGMILSAGKIQFQSAWVVMFPKWDKSWLARLLKHCFDSPLVGRDRNFAEEPCCLLSSLVVLQLNLTSSPVYVFIVCDMQLYHLSLKILNGL